MTARQNLIALMLGMVCSSVVAADALPDPRPNILLAIADDWSWPHAGVYGDTCLKTPTFDRVAHEGAVFTRAFCAAPSCSPSRASILTGQAPHRLENGGNLWGVLPAKFPVYPDVLEKAGYVVGFMGKGWGPGHLGDRTRNPAGKSFRTFEDFLKTVPPGKPFCFWYGSHDPHRPYKEGQGAASGLKIEDVKVPAFLPDMPEVRSDILDYYFAVQRYDHDTGEIIKQIEAAGRLDNTLVVMTSDNGMPFPRAKTNLYDSGSHMPLAVRWPGKVKAGQRIDDLVSLTDLCPTFLLAANIPPNATPPGITGHSFLDKITKPEVAAGSPTPSDPVKPEDQTVFVERERHANVREGNLSYPVRAIRTNGFMYVRNLRPDLWPAGDPKMWKAVGPYGDIDGGITKDFYLSHKDDAKYADFIQLAMAKRPAEELYDLTKDPDQLHNVADYPEYAAAKAKMRAGLDRWMKETADPRLDGGGAYDAFDKYPYVGGPDPQGKRGLPTTKPVK